MNEHRKKIGKKKNLQKYWRKNWKCPKIKNNKNANWIQHWRICVYKIIWNWKKWSSKNNYKAFVRKNAYVCQALLNEFYSRTSPNILLSKWNSKKNYDKYLIEKVYIYHVLTYTDSTCLKFFFVSYPKSEKCGKNLET